jgi:hypothetical protein
VDRTARMSRGQLALAIAYEEINSFASSSQQSLKSATKFSKMIAAFREAGDSPQPIREHNEALALASELAERIRHPIPPIIPHSLSPQAVAKLISEQAPTSGLQS